MNDRAGPACGVIVVALATVLIGACASKGTVVLLPEQDGKPTALTVKRGEHVVVLDQPYAAANVGWRGLDGYQSNPQQVEAKFGEALAAQPRQAEKFVLYFMEGKDEFTEESKRLVTQVLSEVARRPVPDILVVGHTDTVGTDQVNDALGLQRAQAVRAALISLDIPAGDVQAISRGKRALAVATADGVAEPRNRRVEIIVR